MDKLKRAFLQIFEDHLFTSSETQAVQQLLQELAPDDASQGRLRSLLFSWIRTELKSHQSQQLPDWLEEANKALLVKTKLTESYLPDKAYFSPGIDCLQAIIATLRSAIKWAKICVFTISDDRIADEILLCHRRGIHVQILSDNKKLYDTGSDIDRMAKAGISVRIDRTSDHMHHKFAVIDGTTLVTGSYNWTRSAAQFNHENILITQNKPVVQAFEQEFEKLWQQMQAY